MDLKHLSEKIKKHECTRAHMENTIKLAMLGRVNIATELQLKTHTHTHQGAGHEQAHFIKHNRLV